MFNNLKIKISLWYTLLLTVILAATLFSSNKIVGYQMKNDIIRDLVLKTESTKTILTRGEHNDEKTNEHDADAYESNTESHVKDTFYDIKLITDKADDNYILFIYEDGELQYTSEKYKSLQPEIYPIEIPDNNIINIAISDIPFSLSVVQQSGITVYIGYELSSLTDLQNRQLKIFFVIFPIGALLSFICGFFVTQQSMGVIKKIDETTKNITSSNLSKRIETPKGKDEISNLIETLNSMIERLEESFTQAKQFSQDAAHEIRTPLTIIRGEIEELLELETANNKTTKTLENILEEVQYMSSISERLLLIHNMDTNNIKYHFNNVNISELVKEIYQDVLVISMEMNLIISLDVEDGIKLNCNKELITRLLWNIADNAIKYNKPEGSINIILSEEKSTICIVIKDTGIGIPNGDLPKIFDRFYRVDKSRSRELGGSGLGLSICKWITDLHNGNIKVESSLNEGTTFTLFFNK